MMIGEHTQRLHAIGMACYRNVIEFMWLWVHFRHWEDLSSFQNDLNLWPWKSANITDICMLHSRVQIGFSQDLVINGIFRVAYEVGEWQRWGWDKCFPKTCLFPFAGWIGWSFRIRWNENMQSIFGMCILCSMHHRHAPHTQNIDNINALVIGDEWHGTRTTEMINAWHITIEWSECFPVRHRVPQQQNIQI